MKNEKKLAVYTALFGDYDKLIDPKGIFENCDFFCFTDQKNLSSEIWKIIKVDPKESGSFLMNRRYKFLPHLFFSEYQRSLYVDSNIKILGNPFNLAEKYLKKSNLALPKHFERDCLYEEIDECLKLRKIDFVSMENIKYIYVKEGFPTKFGLGENNILLRNHNNPEVIDLMNLWWEYLNMGPRRDQLSLMFLCWKKNVKFVFMDESSRNKNEYFAYNLHKNNFNKITQIWLHISANRSKNILFRIIYVLGSKFNDWRKSYKANK